MKLHNPFPEYGYFGAEYFCDREEETEKLIEALFNGSNVALMAPRHIGKTGFIHHVFEQMKRRDKNLQCFYVDRRSVRWYSFLPMPLSESSTALRRLSDGDSTPLSRLFDLR